MRKEILIAAIAIILILCGGVFAASNMQIADIATFSLNAIDLEDRGSLIVDSEDITASKGYYNSSASDENVVLVKNYSLRLSNSIVNKTGDTGSSGDDADFYGINSAVLVNSNGSVELSDVEIETNSKGSNGVFVTNAVSDSNSNSSSSSGSPIVDSTERHDGKSDAEEPGGVPPEKPVEDGPSVYGGSSGGKGALSDGNQSMPAPGASSSDVEGSSSADISNVRITTHGDKSRGLDATFGGKIIASDVEINTDGQSCAALATDRGEGEVHVKNCILNTGVDEKSGRGSPIIYSTGNITADNSEGCAHVSQIACIEGKNSIALSNCEFSAGAGGNREDNGEYVDLGGVFIYQSMSGDADVGTSLFDANCCVLSIEEDSEYYKTAPMFHVTNTKAIVKLASTELNFGSGVLLNVSGQSQWGTVGSNGGELEFDASDEILDGDVFVDSISSLNMSLASTSFIGAVNPDDDFGETNLVIDSDSDWTLDGDSHLSSLENNGDIDYNGHTLYVDGKAYTESNPFK
ncbi:hypothetical protein [Methanobrevibacter ruminantium]|nr:hypothetical protein [Methanobrevibacter ruminantium]